MGRALNLVSEYWRVNVNGYVFKMFSVNGYSHSDMDMLYPGAVAQPITYSEFMQ